jgi:hypothetical protein
MSTWLKHTWTRNQPDVGTKYTFLSMNSSAGPLICGHASELGIIDRLLGKKAFRLATEFNNIIEG